MTTNTMTILEMADRQTIIDRMSTVNSPDSDIGRVYNRFASLIEQKRKNAAGVCVAFQLAIHEVASLAGAVPMLGVMLNMDFELYMDALFIDNPAFAQECILFMEQTQR